MTVQHSPLSDIGRGIRRRARRDEIAPSVAARRLLFQEQAAEPAIELATEFYERTGDKLILDLIGDFHVVAGKRLLAESIFRSLDAQGYQTHVTNLIYAGIDATVALVEDSRKMLFIPIPKCGSTSVKNYFTQALFGKFYGETVHFQHAELYRIIRPEDLTTTYRDYHKFSVIRDPISRLTSYFMHNVARGSLAREATGLATFQGLSTRPGPRQAQAEFQTYRQLFKDFRHHTDPINGFLGPFLGDLDMIYTMSDLDDLRQRIAHAYGCDIPDARAMVSKQGDELKEKCTEAFEGLRGFYATDYETYF